MVHHLTHRTLVRAAFIMAVGGAPLLHISDAFSSANTAPRIGHVRQSATPPLAPRAVSTTTRFQSSLAADTDIANAATDENQAAASEKALNAAQQQKLSWQDDGFVYGLDGSGLERAKGAGRKGQLVVAGDSTETQTWQQVLVWGTLCSHAVLAAMSLQEMMAMNGGDGLVTSIQAIVVAGTAWIVADFGSGVLHWSVDNYGNGKTPVMGSIIAAFQGHHATPWTICERSFSNNVYKLCLPFGVLPLAVIATLTGPFITFFMTCFCVLEILSQEFHKWAHELKSNVPGWVNPLQAWGVTIARSPHAQHHLAPFDGNYCIISGVCNKALDETGFFRRLEHVIYNWNGVESNAWKLDDELKQRTLSGDYRLVQ